MSDPIKTTSDLPDLWDIEAVQKWIFDQINEGLASTMRKYEGMTSRFCDTCGKAWFFPPANPTECPDCSTEARLLRIHGTEPCHICGLSRTGEGSDICSYPHAMLPRQVYNTDGWGFCVWEAVQNV